MEKNDKLPGFHAGMTPYFYTFAPIFLDNLQINIKDNINEWI